MPVPRGNAGRTHRRKKTPAEWLWPVVGIACIVAVLSLTAWAKYLGEKARVETDPTTLCPVERPLENVTAVLIDISDTLSEPQRADIVNKLERVRADLPRFALLDLYVLSPTGSVLLKPVLSVCNPGDGKDMSSVYENPGLAQKRWTRGFKDRVDAAIRVAIDQPEEASSPILEAIQSIALHSFGPADRDHADRNLVIVSDLLQHAPGKYSQYRGTLDFGVFSKDPYYSSIRSDLKHTSVTVFYMERPGAHGVQGGKHIQFWIKFFNAQGASVDLIDKIFGAT